jgi:hypothetical protein
VKGENAWNKNHKLPTLWQIISYPKPRHESKRNSINCPGCVSQRNCKDGMRQTRTGNVQRYLQRLPFQVFTRRAGRDLNLRSNGDITRITLFFFFIFGRGGVFLNKVAMSPKTNSLFIRNDFPFYFSYFFVSRTNNDF